MRPQEWESPAHDFEGGAFSISTTWKELLTYWEGNQGYVFDCGWGRDPGTVYVPTEEAWDKVLPSWLIGRRAEVVARLAKHSGHIVKDDDQDPHVDPSRSRQR